MSTHRLSAVLAAVAPPMSVPRTPNEGVFPKTTVKFMVHVRNQEKNNQVSVAGSQPSLRLGHSPQMSPVSSRPRTTEVISACGWFSNACYATASSDVVSLHSSLICRSSLRKGPCISSRAGGGRSLFIANTLNTAPCPAPGAEQPQDSSGPKPARKRTPKPQSTLG